LTVSILTIHHRPPMGPPERTPFETVIIDAARVEDAWNIGPESCAGFDDPGYAEMRAHVAAHRRLMFWDQPEPSPTYVGFQHYRRRLMWGMVPGFYRDLEARGMIRRIDAASVCVRVEHPMFQAFEHWDAGGDVRALEAWLGLFDVVTTRPWAWSMRDQFRTVHGAEPWDVLMSLLPENYEVERAPFHPANLYAMRRSVFEGYMDFWMSRMERFSRACPTPDDVYQSRLYGFVSERLFSLWLHNRRRAEPALRVGLLPHVFCPSYPGG
jgi:hypothetical protein